MEYWFATRHVGWKIAAYQKRRSGSVSNGDVVTNTLRNAKTCWQLKNAYGRTWMSKWLTSRRRAETAIFTAAAVEARSRLASMCGKAGPDRNASFLCLRRSVSTFL